MLTIPQAAIEPEQQNEFSAALESGDPIWYRGNCWIVMEHYGPAGGLMNFVLTQVPDRECNQ